LIAAGFELRATGSEQALSTFGCWVARSPELEARSYILLNAF
jgi:hypothetical protein